MNRKYWIGLSIGIVAFLVFAGAPGTHSNSLASTKASSPRQDRNAPSGTPITSTFTYQGQLKLGNTPVTGSCAMALRLYDDPAAGNVVGHPITKTVSITNGLFTVDLSFGNVFDGDALWLDIRVNCGSGFTGLTPRQPLTAAPYASYSASTGALQGRTVTTTAPESGQVLKWNGSAWSPAADAIGSNISAVSAGYGLAGGGTAGEVALSVMTGTIQQRVNGNCAAGASIRSINVDGTVLCETDNDTPYSAGTGLDLTGTQFSITPTYRLPQSCGNNQVAKWNGAVWMCANDAVGGTGSYWSLTGNSGTNPVTNFLGTTDATSLTLVVSSTVAFRIVPNADSPNLIGGHSSNNVSPGVVGATIGGGGAPPPTPGANTVMGSYGTVSGGSSNSAGFYSTVGGGLGNGADGYAATISGGALNAAGAAGTIGGGIYNAASGSYSTVGGGYLNQANADYATIAGGGTTDGTGITTNAVNAPYGTIGGGGNNQVGNSFSTIAGGRSNTTNGQYATIPGGQGNTANGNYSFAAGRQAQALHAGTFVWADSAGVPVSSTAENQFIVRASGGITLYTSGTSTAGATLPPGSGSWSSVSDRNAKSNFAAVDEIDVLKRLAAIPIQTWSYKAQSLAIQHIGPMAQDFYAAFSVGEDNTHISTVDADGVALAAIQGLYQVVRDKDALIAVQQRQIANLETRLSRLEQKASTVDPSASATPFTLFNLLGMLAFAGVVILWLQQRSQDGGIR
jgi:trimeric autotransporter adhesin